MFTLLRLAVVAALLLGGLAYARYDTLVPCTMLKREIMRQAEHRGGALASGLAALAADAAQADMTQRACAERLWRLYTEGRIGPPI